VCVCVFVCYIPYYGYNKEILHYSSLI